MTITEDEIAVIAEFIPRFRAGYSQTQPFGASLCSLGIPALGQHDRIARVLVEMEKRGMVERTDQAFDHLVGEPRYRETDLLPREHELNLTNERTNA